MSADDDIAVQNNDRGIWRRVPDDYYSPSIHVTDGGGIGMNVGGTVIVMDIEDWHLAASERGKIPDLAIELRDVPYVVLQAAARVYHWMRSNNAKLLHGLKLAEPE